MLLLCESNLVLLENFGPFPGDFGPKSQIWDLIVRLTLVPLDASR